MSRMSVDPKQNFFALQQQILSYWKENRTFEASIERRSADEPYRFYDGPPFITGTPHYGSLLSSIIKDAVPRYWTMRGKRVERVWGWDCHGLPIEEKVQKKLGLESVRDVERVGIERFIEECYTYTRETSAEWEWYVENIGRWVDLKNAYRTMDQNYMESVLWVFQQAWQKGLVYQGKRVSLYSTKLSTPISNFEVAMDNSYAEVNDPAVTIAFDISANGDAWKNTSMLAWTTTPWTLPANMALAVNTAFSYAVVAVGEKRYVVAESRIESVFRDKEYTVERVFSGADLVGLSYVPPYPEYYVGKIDASKNHRVYHADFITSEDGTGIGHEAPEFGDVDFELAREVGLHITEAINDEGKYTAQIADREGRFYRDENDTIMAELAQKGLLFRKEGITHRVAMCPRTGTPLIYKAQKSWFIDIQNMKDRLYKANEQINWYPDHFKEGRFRKSMESAPDWCISRTRYWGAPMPVWQNGDGSEQIVVGSRDELYELSRPTKTLTRLILVRHGRTDYNEKSWHDTLSGNKARLTEEGQKQAKNIAERFGGYTVDAIYSSPQTRCIDTITPLASLLGKEIISTPELREMDKVSFQDKLFKCDMLSWDEEKIGNDETLQECYARMQAFYQEILKKHPGQTVVVCSHGEPLALLRKAIHNYDYATERPNYYQNNNPAKKPDNQAVVEYVFSDTLKPLDLHRPYIDRVKIISPKTGQTLTRIPEVLDVWMDSGSMPYAQMHYPFENRTAMEASFPADFIAEYVGQVRAWFYVMHVLGVVLFDSPAFRNVCVTGVIYGTDGRKMSKSYKNYPDPRGTIEKHGADAIRAYLLSSPLLSGGDINFSEDGITETTKRLILPLWNAYSFLATYANTDAWEWKQDGIWLMRHGETDNNSEGRANGGNSSGSLNANGIAQVRAAAECMIQDGLTFDVIVSSPSLRAQETAKIVQEALGGNIPLVTEDGFLEQNYGEWGGMYFDDMIEAYFQKTGIRVPRADVWRIYRESNSEETFAGFVERVVAAYQKTTNTYAGKRVLVVGHGGTSRALTSHFFGLTSPDVHRRKVLRNAQYFRLPNGVVENVLDRAILSRLHGFIQDTNTAYETYDMPRVCRLAADFLDEVTNFYIRRSRRRFWGNEWTADKRAAYDTLSTVLVRVCQVLAPVLPFVTESVWRGITGWESVHLSRFPDVIRPLQDVVLDSRVEGVRALVQIGLSIRAEKKIRVRQPLPSITIGDALGEEFEAILREELNVKQVIVADMSSLARKICRPNARLIGARLGAAVQDVIKQAKAGNFSENSDGSITVGEHTLAAGEFEVAYEPLSSEQSLSVQGAFGRVVALDTTLTQDLILEGYARDIIRTIQDARREAGYNVSDRIRIYVTSSVSVAKFSDMITSETLSRHDGAITQADITRKLELDDGFVAEIRLAR